MALTDDERRRLDQIERWLRTTDPRLDRALSRGRRTAPGPRRLGSVLLVVAMLAMLPPATVTHGVLFFAALVLVVVGTYLTTFADG